MSRDSARTAPNECADRALRGSLLFVWPSAEVSWTALNRPRCAGAPQRWRSGLSGDRDPVHLTRAGRRSTSAQASNVAPVVRMSSTRITRTGARRPVGRVSRPQVPHPRGPVEPVLALRLAAAHEDVGDGEPACRCQASATSAAWLYPRSRRRIGCMRDRHERGRPRKGEEPIQRRKRLVGEHRRQP